MSDQPLSSRMAGFPKLSNAVMEGRSDFTCLPVGRVALNRPRFAGPYPHSFFEAFWATTFQEVFILARTSSTVPEKGPKRSILMLVNAAENRTDSSML